MLIVRTISSGVVPYFADGRDAGTWTAGAGRLLELQGPVEPAALRAVLSGRHPASGTFLPAVRPRRRRGGWDLVFGAPKSVSLLGATTARGEDVADAHRAAVRQSLDYLERRLTVVRSSEPSGTAPAGGLIGASFQHRSNAAAEPHLHTHVLIANLTRTGRGWSAVRSEQWFIGRRSLAALYQMALRTELSARGWQLEWRLRPDGLADVADVPSAAIRATSTQGRLAVTNGRYPARQAATPRPWRAQAREAGWAEPAGLEPAAPSAPDAGEARGWRPELAPPGPERGTAEVRGGRDGADPWLLDRDLTARVTARLATRRSDFSKADVIVALAASHGPGAAPEAAAAWAERFCNASLPVRSPTAGRRWTTDLAKGADDRLLEALRDLNRTAPLPTEGRTGLHPEGGLAPPPGGVVMLGAPAGRSALLAQAEQVDRWRQAWSAGGIRAAVDCPTPLAAARWAVLSGLPAYRRGQGVDVLVVDQADRRSAADLLRLTADARRSGTTLVFVEGGTLPRVTNLASHGLARFAAEADRLFCPPATGWDRAAPGPVVDRHPATGLAGRAAVEALLGLWAADPRGALLVGLGLEEVRALNLAARRLTGGAGRAVEVDAGPRSPDFRAGDRVVVIRAREGLPPYGTFGDVVNDGRRGSAVSVRWVGHPRASTYRSGVLAGLGHGWAVTAHMAVRLGRPVMVLGAAEAVPRLRGLVRAEVEPPRRGRSLVLER